MKTLDDLKRSKDRSDQIHWLYLIGNDIRDAHLNGTGQEQIEAWFSFPDQTKPAWFKEKEMALLVRIVEWEPRR